MSKITYTNAPKQHADWQQEDLRARIAQIESGIITSEESALFLDWYATQVNHFEFLRMKHKQMPLGFDLHQAAYLDFIRTLIKTEDAVNWTALAAAHPGVAWA